MRQQTWKNPGNRWARQGARLALVAAAVASPLAALADGGFVALSSKGRQVLASCNPHDLPARQRCRVASLPGEPGYTLVASLSNPLVKNEITVGTVLDQVWKNDEGDYIFGLRVELNAQPYDLSGLSFNVNDIFRQVRKAQPASVAYEMADSGKALRKSGRTMQGLNEPDPEDDDDGDLAAAGFLGRGQPTRNNGWVDFRIDANAAEASGPSSANSPWLLVKTRAPAGFSVQPFAVRVLSSDFADESQNIEIYVPGHQPN